MNAMYGWFVTVSQPDGKFGGFTASCRVTDAGEGIVFPPPDAAPEALEALAREGSRKRTAPSWCRERITFRRLGRFCPGANAAPQKED